MFVLLVFSLTLAPPAVPAAPSGAQPIAVLPVTGDGVSLADLGLLEDMDAVVRSAIGERKGLALQPREITAETFRSSRGAGVECKVSDLPCMRQVAALAGVDLMLVPVASVESAGGVELELTLVSVVDESIVTRTVIIKGRGRAADAFVRATVDDVMTAPRRKAAAVPAQPAPSQAPAHVAAAPADAAPANAPADAPIAADATSADAAEEEPPVWPLVAGGIGGAILVVAAVGVGVAYATGAFTGGGGGGDADPTVPTSGPVTVVLE